MKCPFMGGKAIPYKNVCINHIPQIMLEMFCTSTKQCHYVVWTPIGTKVFLIERDDAYIELLLNYLYKFWDLASRKLEPAWHEDVFGLKQKSKEIALKSPCIRFISNSLVTPDALSHDDLKKFAGVPNDNNQKQKTKIPRKCQGCKEDEWRCKLNPCEVRLKRTSTCNALAAYQSYKYGSNGIHNSCHQDTFLEIAYHAFKHQLNCPSNSNLGEGLTQLLSSFVLREHKKFHDSKMNLWRWLRDNTIHGHTYYAYGKEAALDSINTETMPNHLKERFALKTKYAQACANVNGSHSSCRNYTHSVFPISTDDVLDNHFLLNSQEFDIIQVIRHKLTLNNFVGLSKCSVLMDNDSVMAISANSDCAIIPQPNTCNAPLQQSTTVVNSPDIFFVGYTHNPSKKHIPSLPVDSKCNMEVNHCTYRISGIVYLKFHHYFCEVYPNSEKL